MLKKAIVCGLLVVGLSAQAYDKLPEEKVNQIVNAIYKIEGGNQTKYPYGIRSLNTSGNISKAKLICENTVRNNYIRWQKAGRTNDFLNYLGNVYCPTSGNLSSAEQKLNKNWIGNLKKELNNKN